MTSNVGPALSPLSRGANDASDGDVVVQAVRASLDRALNYLRKSQRADASWAGELSSSPLATALAIAALHYADAVRFAPQIERGRAWLFDHQRADGGWGDALDDPSNLNSTSIVLGALLLSYDGNSAGRRQALERGMARLRDFGGWEAVGDPTLCTLSGPSRTLAALAGLMDPRSIKRLRPEVILVPRRFRRTISTTFPAYLSIARIHSCLAPHWLNSLPTYGRSLQAGLAWLAHAQGPDGSFEASAFLTSVIVTCLTASGMDSLPWLAPALRFILDSQRADGSWPIDKDLETFDTDLCVFAFAAAGEPVPRGDAVRHWLVARQLDTACFPTGARPGGWAWTMPAGWPDVDDTSFTLLALHALGESHSSATMRRGSRWLAQMQNRDGSWSTFVRHSSMPFDHDCPYVTGHALAALKATGYGDRHARLESRALAYLRTAQRDDGSFASLWFRESTAGTASALEALVACGEVASIAAAQAQDALMGNQNDDGGWAGLRLQASTAEETAWAIMALACVPENPRVRTAIQRGVSWLLAHQCSDGTWVPAPIGLYYSAMWYSDSFYAVTLPAVALARVWRHHASV
jgi:squalene-hopene/tetraprenyl-beta-curcumene cyclase